MNTWKENNCLRKFNEAEDRNYLEDLKKLIAAEAVASWQYAIAAESIIGPNQSYLVSHFTEHAGEEWGHYQQLVAALMQRDGEAILNLRDIVSMANPATEELVSSDSEYFRNFFAEAEDAAIKAYQAFYEEIQDADPDLADIINTIISDEREHKLDLERIVEG